MTTFSETQHPRGTGGRFATKQHPEPDVALDDALDAGTQPRVARPNHSTAPHDAVGTRSAGVTDGVEWTEHPYLDADYVDLHEDQHRVIVDSGVDGNEPSVRWATVQIAEGKEIALYSEDGETRDDLRRRAVEMSHDLAAARREQDLHDRAAHDLFRGFDPDEIEPPF